MIMCGLAQMETVPFKDNVSVWVKTNVSLFILYADVLVCISPLRLCLRLCMHACVCVCVCICNSMFVYVYLYLLRI